MGSINQKTLIVILFFMAISLSKGFGQSINQNWKSDLSTALKEFKSCDNDVEHGIGPCNKFIGESLQTVYRINDFYAKDKSRYMLVSEISEYLDNSDKWTLLGKAYEQNALKKAQEYANSRKAVVAVYLNEENIGHVSVILPGELSPSGTWGFQVPNSASFFTAEPEKSYVNKSLSYAFARNHIKDVMIFARNY